MNTLTVQLNGRAWRGEVAPATLLVHWLREEQRLTGTHVGCDTVQCGACTVLVDGRAVKSCSMLAIQAQGCSVTTIEGLAPSAGGLNALQEAFGACHGLQCGFCTPGMILAAQCLLSEVPSPTDAQVVQALDGNLCRCTGYVNIVAAVQQAARVLRESGAVAAAGAGAPR